MAAALLGAGWCDVAAAQRRAPAEDKPPAAFTLAGARSLFQRVDKDSDGAVSAAEAPAAGLGPRDLSAADADNNGKLNANEFLIGLHGAMKDAGRTLAKDFDDEVAKLRAAKPAPTPAGKPNSGPTPKPGASAPRTPPAAGEAAGAPSPARALEQKIAEALRKAEAAESDGGEAERPRTAAKSGAGATPTNDALAGLSQEAQEALTRRLRNSGVTPATAAAEREALQVRIENARAANDAGAGSNSATSKGANPGEAKPPEAPAAARAAASEATAPKRPAAPPVDTPSSGASTPRAPAPADRDLDAAGRAQLEQLEQRLKNMNATPEQAEEARQDLLRRIENAKKRAEREESAPGEKKGRKGAERAGEGSSGGESDAGGDPRARLMRQQLQQRLENSGASETEIQEALAKLEKRLQNQASGSPGDAESDASKPAAGGAKAKRDGGGDGPPRDGARPQPEKPREGATPAGAGGARNNGAGANGARGNGGQGAQPAGGAAKPAGGAAQPAGGAAKPAGGAARPAGGAAKPAGGEAKPAGGEAKPAGGQGAPPAGGPKPARANAKPKPDSPQKP